MGEAGKSDTIEKQYIFYGAGDEGEKFVAADNRNYSSANENRVT